MMGVTALSTHLEKLGDTGLLCSTLKSLESFWLKKHRTSFYFNRRDFPCFYCVPLVVREETPDSLSTFFDGCTPLRGQGWQWWGCLGSAWPATLPSPLAPYSPALCR